MRPVFQQFLIFTLLIAQSNIATAQPNTRTYDIVIYGGTAAGVMAAVAAAKDGAKVALLEQGRHVGGMLSGGLSNTDIKNQQHVIGGMAREFFEKARKHYNQPALWTFEHHFAEKVLNDWLREAGVEVLFNHRVDSVTKEGNRIRSIKMENGAEFSAKVFIDASYEGDILPRAGITYTVGRESINQYNESLAGRQEILPGQHQFSVPVSPYDKEGKKRPYVVFGI